MLFTVGIEPPANDNEAYGIIVPVFEKLGYGCFSAADEQSQVLHNAKDAILSMAEQVVTDGHLISELDVGYQDFESDYPDFKKWIAIEVPVEILKSKPKRINITMNEMLLARVDNYVSQHSEYRDRSDFLSVAADNLMRT